MRNAVHRTHQEERGSGELKNHRKVEGKRSQAVAYILGTSKQVESGEVCLRSEPS